MTVDPRCLIATDLGILKDGSGLSEDHAQETGLVTYRGTFIFDGLHTPTRGRVIQVAYARPQYGSSGLLTRFYPRLHVISSSADPFANDSGVTTVEVGCKLSLMSERRDATTYRAIDHPPAWWSALTADRRAVVPPTISAQAVIEFCLDKLGITLAAGSAASPDTYLRDEIDLSGGYVQTVNDLLRSALLVGHMTPEGELFVQPVALEPDTGPVLTRANLISLQPINDRAGAEQVTVEFDAFEAPSNVDPGSIDINSDAQKLRDWEVERTIGPPTTYTISIQGRRFIIGYGGTDSDTERPEDDLRFDLDVQVIQVSENRTSYRTIEYTDESGKLQTQDVAIRRTSSVRSSILSKFYFELRDRIYVFGGIAYPAFLFPPNGGIPYDSDTYTEYEYETTASGPRLKSELTSVYSSGPKFAGILPVENWEVSGGPAAIPSDAVQESKVLVENEVDEVAGLTKRKTTRWAASAKTQGGSQASRLAFENVLDQVTFTRAYQAAQPLVMEGTEVSISLGRQSGLQSRPSAQARQRDALSGAFRDDNSLTSSGQVATSYGQREPQTVTATYVFGGGSADLWNTATYRLTYGPDDTITAVNGTSTGIVDLTLLRGNARGRALEYGRVQNAIAFGHANGIEVTTAPWELPSKPFAAVYLDVAGLSTAFRVHGRNWAIANGAMICTADLMFVGTVGRLSGATPTPWMPLTSDASALPVIGAPSGSGDILPANTITLPGGFDPDAPGTVWASLPDDGNDTYGPSRTPASIAPPYVQTVQTLARSRSIAVTTELLYSLTPVVEQVEAVSRSLAETREVALARMPATSLELAALAPFVYSPAIAYAPATTLALAAVAPASVTGSAYVPVPAMVLTLAAPAPNVVGDLFSPIDLSPLAWWDASDSGTVTTASGDVTDWSDKSGNGWTVSQVTAGNRPAYTSAAINGLNAIEWSSSANNDYLQSASGTFTAEEFYMVVKHSSTTQFFAYEGALNGAGSSSANGWFVGDASAPNLFFATPSYLNANNSTDRATNMFSELGSTCLVRCKKSSGTFTTTAGVVIGNDRNNFGFDRGWRGFICEIVAFSTALGTGDRGDLEAYLMDKWGIP